MAVADVLRPLDGAEAQFACGGRRLLSTALRESVRDQAAAFLRTRAANPRPHRGVSSQNHRHVTGARVPGRDEALGAEVHLMRLTPTHPTLTAGGPNGLRFF